MKRCWAGFILGFAAAITGCESTPTAAPAVSAAMAQSGAKQHADQTSLTSGRLLFISRCARCHTLPKVGEQSADDWPGIVAVMSKRSGLKAEQSKAVLAYILAAQATPPQ